MRWIARTDRHAMTGRFLIVGLGNPGREYENTRHNIGFRCADAIADASDLRRERRKRSNAIIAEGAVAGRRVLIAKPQTFMNRSGSAVQGLAAFYKIAPEHILVIYDDLDLPVAALRIRSQGGSGGHRGMADIIRKLGTQAFPRIRFGIGRPPGRMDPAAYVLQRFAPAEEQPVAQAVEQVVAAVTLWLSEDINAAMNQFNTGTSAAPADPPDGALPPPSPDSRRDG